MTEDVNPCLEVPLEDFEVLPSWYFSSNQSDWPQYVRDEWQLHWAARQVVEAARKVISTLHIDHESFLDLEAALDQYDEIAPKKPCIPCAGTGKQAKWFGCGCGPGVHHVVSCNTYPPTIACEKCGGSGVDESRS